MFGYTLRLKPRRLDAYSISSRVYARGNSLFDFTLQRLPLLVLFACHFVFPLKRRFGLTAYAPGPKGSGVSAVGLLELNRQLPIATQARRQCGPAK